MRTSHIRFAMAGELESTGISCLKLDKLRSLIKDYIDRVSVIWHSNVLLSASCFLETTAHCRNFGSLSSYYIAHAIIFLRNYNVRVYSLAQSPDRRSSSTELMTAWAVARAMICPTVG